MFLLSVENSNVGSSLEWVICLGAACRKQPSVGEERVSPAKQIERPVIWRAQRCRSRKRVWRGPNGADRHTLGDVAEIWRTKSRLAAAGTSEEQRASVRQQRGMNRQYAGGELLHLPGTVHRRIGVQVQT